MKNKTSGLQFIRASGRIIRLDPFNEYTEHYVEHCPKIRVESDDSGFYRETSTGIEGWDVTYLEKTDTSY